MNNITQLPNPEIVKEEAGIWLARLDRGELSSQERTDLSRWMARSDFHKDYLHRLVDNWDSMDVLSELADLFPLKSDEVEQPRSQRWRYSWMGASAVALTAMVVLLVNGPVSKPPVNTLLPERPSSVVYHTAIGDFTSVKLQDGTAMKLNTNSLVEVQFTDQLRTVTLLRGEAGFKVASDPQKPFVVRGGDGMALAVGTQFNVRLLNDSVDVTVTEGKVKVIAGAVAVQPQVLLTQEIADKTHQILLTAGESVRYDQSIVTLEVHEQSAMEQKLAWQRGSLIFNGESLQEAIAEISRYTNQQLLIIDPRISDIPIGGHFKTDDIEGLIAALATNFSIRAEQVAPNQIHLYSE